MYINSDASCPSGIELANNMELIHHNPEQNQYIQVKARPMFIAHGSVKIFTNTCDAMFFDNVPTVSEYIAFGHFLKYLSMEVLF